MKNGTAYVRFNAPVNESSAEALFNVIDVLVNIGMTKLHLLLQTQGGSVPYGIAIHNYLKGRPIETTTYNIGAVDSIGVVIYCAGKIRFCVPQCSFTIHRIETGVKADMSADYFKILEKGQSFECDNKNISTIISSATGISEKDVGVIMLQGHVWNAQTAIDRKLAQQIKSELVPQGCRVDAIVNDRGWMFDLPIQQAAGLPAAVPPPPAPRAQ